MLSPTTSTVGSCFASPFSTASSVLIASTCPCCSIRRQSVQVVAPKIFGLGLSSYSFESEVVPDTAHTRLPASAAAVIDSRTLRGEDFLVGFVVHRGEIDELLALTGDRVGPHHHVHLAGLQHRFALVRIDHSQLDAVWIAEDAPARSRVRCRCRSPPVARWRGSGSRTDTVFWSTPAMSRPRSAIAAIVEPGGMAPGGGSGPGRRLASRSQSAFPAAGAVAA